MDNELVREYLIARAEMDKAKVRLDDAAGRLIKQMESDQRKSFRWDTDGVRRTINYIQKRTTVIDEQGLRKALTAKVYDKYTKRVLDRKAMEDAMGIGAVDEVTVARFVSFKPQRPYLEYREKETTTNEENE